MTVCPALNPYCCIAIALLTACLAAGTATAGQGDPFGPQQQEPFELGPEERQDRAHAWVEEGIGQAESVLRHAPGDRLLLHTAPALLHAATGPENYGADIIGLLQRLADHRWQRKPGETVRQMLERLEQHKGPAIECLSVPDPEARYRELVETPWPLDWRQRGGFWLELVETVLTSGEQQQPARPWQTRVQADPQHAPLYRLAYLAVAAGALDKPFDLELLRPLMDDQQLTAHRGG